jgi:fucose permease
MAELPPPPPPPPPSAAVPVPASVRTLLTLFFFLYVGAESGYGGWVTTFVLESGTTADHAAAAYASAVFWALLTLGRAVAIPTAVFVTTTSALRGQLALSVLGAALTASIAKLTYPAALGASAVLGYGLSSIFPLAMTLVADYGLEMDPNTTTLFVLGSTFGEAIVPVLIGLAMGGGRFMALPFIVVILVGLFCLLYAATHVNLLAVVARRKAREAPTASSHNGVSPWPAALSQSQ